MVPIAFRMLLNKLTVSRVNGCSYWKWTWWTLVLLISRNEPWDLSTVDFPLLGASTDFGPLLANPKTILLVGQLNSVFPSHSSLSVMWGMTPQEAASVGIIEGADGPTALFLTTRLAPHLLPAIALAAYSYMALCANYSNHNCYSLTTKKERLVKMTENRKVSETEKFFPQSSLQFLSSLLVPSATPLSGMLNAR